MRRVIALRTLGVLLLAAGVVPLANLITDGRQVPWYGGAAGEWAARGVLLLVGALITARITGNAFDVIVERLEAELLRPSRTSFTVFAATFALLSALFIAWWSFSGRPFTSDEMAQLWHARILAAGRLFAQTESLREFFNTAPVLDHGGKWFSQYPVGGPAFIALGVLVGAPWVVNPILSAVIAASFYRFCATIGTELRARGATILLLLSPMVLVMAGSQMNHVPALACTAVALWSVAHWEKTGSVRAAAIAGLSLGLLATVRPLDAALVALVLGAVQLRRAAAEPGLRRGILVQAAVGAIPVLFLLWANARTTGGAFLFGYEALNGSAHGIGFHADPNGDMHTPLHGIVLASGYLMKLSLYLFEWPLPGVLIIAVGALAVRVPTRWDAALAALITAFLLAYGAYWFDGFFAGPRFLFTAIPAFVWFASAFPGALPDAAPAVARRAMVLAIPACLLVAWIGPWGVSSAPSRIDVYREQRTKLKTDLEAQATFSGVKNALVFVNEGWRGRLEARLRVLGATQFRAERILNTVDACALQTQLDRADGGDNALESVVDQAAKAGRPEPVPNLPADQQIALVPGSRPTPTCLAEFQSDSIGTIPYALALTYNRVGPNGRVGGNIIFVRDLGAQNEKLRRDFGDRTWYRYRPTQDPTSVAFVKY